MGRPRGSTNKPKTAKPKSNGSPPKVAETDHGRNNGDLTDNQQHALLDQSSRAYDKAFRAKQAADANLKNVCKTIKSDGVKLSAVKLYLEAETDEGQARIRERVAEAARIARWRCFPLGAQAELFPEGQTPSMSYTSGKEAGMAGMAAQPSANANVDEFMRGWQDGQAALAGGGFSTLPEDDDIRPEFLRQREASSDEL